MKAYKYVWLLFLVIFAGCNANKHVITLTPEQANVKIEAGIQEITLKLSKTHVPLATEKVPSEYQARIRAVALGADVAQLIFNNNQTMYTYRFWKLKN